VIGSAWRCTIFQTPSSGRMIIVARRVTGLTTDCPPTLALARSILTMYAGSGVTYFDMSSTPRYSPSRNCDAPWSVAAATCSHPWTTGAKGVSEGYVLSMGAHFLCRFRISFHKLSLRKRELLDQFVNVVFCTHLGHLRFI